MPCLGMSWDLELGVVHRQLNGAEAQCIRVGVPRWALRLDRASAVRNHVGLLSFWLRCEVGEDEQDVYVRRRTTEEGRSFALHRHPGYPETLPAQRDRGLHS